MAGSDHFPRPLVTALWGPPPSWPLSHTRSQPDFDSGAAVAKHMTLPMQAERGTSGSLECIITTVWSTPFLSLGRSWSWPLPRRQSCGMFECLLRRLFSRGVDLWGPPLPSKQQSLFGSSPERSLVGLVWMCVCVNTLDFASNQSWISQACAIVQISVATSQTPHAAQLL